MLGIAEDQLLAHLAAGAEPAAVGQAPNGELNEKCRGSSSGSEMPQTGQP